MVGIVEWWSDRSLAKQCAQLAPAVGQRRALVHVLLQQRGQRQVQAHGGVEFGIAPFSILGGAIQVQDRVELRFRIRAKRGS